MRTTVTNKIVVGSGETGLVLEFNAGNPKAGGRLNIGEDGVGTAFGAAKPTEIRTLRNNLTALIESSGFHQWERDHKTTRRRRRKGTGESQAKTVAASKSMTMAEQEAATKEQQPGPKGRRRPTIETPTKAAAATA